MIVYTYKLNVKSVQVSICQKVFGLVRAVSLVDYEARNSPFTPTPNRKT